MHWHDYCDTHAILCTWCYTSCGIQQTWNQTAKCTSWHAPNYTLKYIPDCTSLYTPSMLDLHCQDAPKLTPSMLPSTPLSTFPSTLPGMLSRMLRIALDGTLLACWTIRFQVGFQEALNHTSEHALKYTPSCTPWHSPSLLISMLRSMLWRQSQEHLRLCCQYTPVPLSSMLSRGKTLRIALDYILPCTLLHA